MSTDVYRKCIPMYTGDGDHTSENIGPLAGPLLGPNESFARFNDFKGVIVDHIHCSAVVQLQFFQAVSERLLALHRRSVDSILQHDSVVYGSILGFNFESFSNIRQRKHQVMTDNYEGWTLDSVLSSIRLYARDNDLGPRQIKDIFEAGMAARSVICRRSHAKKHRSEMAQGM